MVVIGAIITIIGMVFVLSVLNDPTTFPPLENTTLYVRMAGYGVVLIGVIFLAVGIFYLYEKFSKKPASPIKVA